MAEYLFTETIGNAGMSFTDLTNSNFLKMYMFSQGYQGPKITYPEYQQKVYENCGVSESNVRMYAPFFYFNGFINKYKELPDGKINVNEFFTPLGAAYATALMIKAKMETSSDNMPLVEKIIHEILTLGLYNRKKINQKDYYFDFLSLCIRYRKTNATEFNLMLYNKEQQHETEYISSIETQINKYRSNEESVSFNQRRRSKQGELIVASFPDNTFNYTRNLLVECGLITSSLDGYYLIPESKTDVVNDLLKGE